MMLPDLESAQGTLVRLISTLNALATVKSDTLAAAEVVKLSAAQAAIASGTALDVALYAQGYTYAFVYLLAHKDRF